MKIKSFMKIQLGQHVARWNYVPAAAAAYQSLFVSGMECAVSLLIVANYCSVMKLK